MKKAAFSLSVNAIVILILAIVMLGLGVTFIRTMFGKVSGQIEEMISNEPEPQSPFRSEPITLSREHIITTAGETEVLKVSVYNAWGTGGGPATPTGPTNYDCTLLPDITSGSYGSAGDDIYIQSAGFDDNVCNLVLRVGGGQICIWGGTGTGCLNAMPGNCDQISATATVSSRPGGWVASRYDDSNYAACEGLGCGPSNGATCTDVLTGTGPAGGNATPEIWCSNTQLLDIINQSLQTYTKPIQPGDSGTFNLIFDIGNIPTATYLCQVRLREQSSYSKDFVIDVRRS